METTGSLGNIFIGAALEEWSERRVLEYVHASLTTAGQPFVIFANFHVGGRQVDCVVATAQRVLVLEVKSSRLPVRGNIDGDWERLHPSGEWRHYPNGYRQALAVKNRLRDAMRQRSDVGAFYPDATVVFVEPLPLGSALTKGDFKVEVRDLNQLDLIGAEDRSCPWSLDDWRELAASLSLRRTSLAELISGPSLEAAFTLLHEYRDRVASELEREGRVWLFESEEQREALVGSLDHPPGCYIYGPSGCGKTLAAKWLGSRQSKAGECVIFLAAKDYDGSWAKLLKRELALVMDIAPSSLFSALRATGCPVRIVLDGVNELGAAGDRALRGLRAVVRRLDGRVLVTGQSSVPAQLGGLATVAIDAPSLALKERIAGAELPLISPSIRELLKAVASGFEAAIVAEIGAEISAGASRQLLVDQFIRKRLGKAARSGSAGLRRLAETLIDTTTFSMSETSFDELMIAAGLAAVDIEAAVTTRILVRRSGRVSFAHEILLNACAAFAFAQHAVRAGEKFAYLLALPALAPIATDILSVIEDARVVRTILETTSDHALLFEAAQGLAGSIAAVVAKELLDQIEAALEGEVKGLRLSIISGELPSVDWDPASLLQWSDAETARIHALAREVGRGHRIDGYFQLCATMDANLLDERRRLADTAAEAGVMALKSEAFRLAYQGFGRETGFAMLSRTAASGMHDIVGQLRDNPARDMVSLTSGQLHFYLERRRLFLDHISDDDLAEGLAAVINHQFPYEPYHVKLAILHAAIFARGATSEKLQALIEAIEAIDASRESLWFSSAIVDALKFLGALEDSAEESRDGIREQFVRATGLCEDEDIRGLALTVSVAMFDHPFDYIYGDEFEALPTEKRRLLIRRAARAPDARKCANLAWVIREVASYEDPADAAIMQEFAALPDPRNAFPQEEWAAFTVATRFLGRHRCDLPGLAGETDAERALIFIRALLYAAEGGAKEQPPDLIWAALDFLPAPVVIGCLSEVEAALREHHWSEERGAPRPTLLSTYAMQCLSVARRFLDAGEEATYFRAVNGREGGSDLAFGIVEIYGDRSDIARLRTLTQAPRFARRALSALRKLDSA